MNRRRVCIFPSHRSLEAETRALFITIRVRLVSSYTERRRERTDDWRMETESMRQEVKDLRQ